MGKGPTAYNCVVAAAAAVFTMAYKTIFLF